MCFQDQCGQCRKRKVCVWFRIRSMWPRPLTFFRNSRMNISWRDTMMVLYGFGLTYQAVMHISCNNVMLTFLWGSECAFPWTTTLDKLHQCSCEQSIVCADFWLVDAICSWALWNTISQICFFVCCVEYDKVVVFFVLWICPCDFFEKYEIVLVISLEKWNSSSGFLWKIWNSSSDFFEKYEIVLVVSLKNMK